MEKNVLNINVISRLSHNTKFGVNYHEHICYQYITFSSIGHNN
jgi:hypothetical protein